MSTHNKHIHIIFWKTALNVCFHDLSEELPGSSKMSCVFCRNLFHMFFFQRFCKSVFWSWHFLGAFIWAKKFLRGEYKQQRCRSASGYTQSDQELYNTSLCSIVANDSISGQERTLSDCGDAQADLGLRWSHMPEDRFSHGAAQLYFTSGMIH